MPKKQKKRKKKKKLVIAVSGGFDPIHVGHVRLFRKAKKLGDELVVILNNDNWLQKKKGFIFMPQRERREVIEAIEGVDRVVLSKHPKNPSDMSVCGGDRNKSNIPEVDVCRSISCAMVFNIGKGGKVQSSSWLLKKFLDEKLPKKS